jgi:hypothetical protein
MLTSLVFGSGQGLVVLLQGGSNNRLESEGC